MSNFKVIVKGIGAYLPGEKVSIQEIDDYFGKIPGIEMSKYYKIIEKYAGVKYRYYALEKGSGKLFCYALCYDFFDAGSGWGGGG